MPSGEARGAAEGVTSSACQPSGRSDGSSVRLCGLGYTDSPSGSTEFMSLIGSRRLGLVPSVQTQAKAWRRTSVWGVQYSTVVKESVGRHCVYSFHLTRGRALIDPVLFYSLDA